MATQYSNKPIITDGLVYALDFGNQKSYVSGSATANSLIYRPVPAKFETLLPGDIAQPAAAYSVRKVVSSYTGSAMMVQSASVSQSIGFDADGNLDTASLASFAGSGDAFVKIWYDQSGNEYHVSQSTAANQPQIVNNGVVITENGKPIVSALLKNAGLNYLINPNKTLINGHGYYQVGKILDPLNTNYISLHSFSNNTTTDIIALNGFNDNPKTYVISKRDGDSTQHGKKLLSLNNNQYLLSSNGTLNNLSAFVNSFEETTSGLNGVLQNVGIYIGSFSSTTVSTNWALQEWIVYTFDQSLNRTKIEGNINQYYQIYTSSYNPTPNPDNDFLDFTNDDILQTQQSFPGFSYDQGNSTVMYVGETKGNSTTFTQDGTLSIVSTTSSVGFGSPSNNFGRSYPVTGLKHVTIRFSSGSVDCFINGLPVSASAVFPTGSSIGGGQLNIPLYTGSLGSFQVYNRPLTSDEIWNNYQLAAPRYELGPLQNKPYNLDENAYLFLQSTGITDPIITSSIDTFVRGLKSNNLWDKMIAIYPFVGTGSDGTNLTGSHRWNLKEPSLVTYPLSFTGSWIGSTSGSAPSGSNTNISVNGITPSQYYPFFNTQSAHISILSYDTPVSSSYLMGTGMTEDLAISTLAGDYGTPAAAYSVRKVRTAYSGALMDVRRDYDNVTSSIGFVSNGDLDTGSLLDWVVPGRNDLPGEYDGLAAAYSLRRVSGSYTGDAIEVRRDWDNESGSFGFDANGDLDTVSLLTFVTGSAGTGSGFVQTWYDQSGNGRHATQTATGSQPLIVSSGSLVTEKGKPALSFNGNNRLISPTFTTITHPVTTFVAYKYTSITNNGAGIIHSLSGNAGFLSRDTSINITSGQTLFSNVVAANNTPYLTYALFNETNSEIKVNNTLVTGSSGTENRVYNRVTLGDGYGNDFNGAFAMQGTISEFILYSGSQTTNRPLIENNINNYYNIYTGSNHGFVARWYDQSGNNRHAVQTTQVIQPQVVNSGSIILENGKSSALFASDTLAVGNLSFLTEAELFVTVKSLSNTNGFINFGTDGAINHYPFSNGQIYDGFGTNTRKDVGTPVVSISQLIIYNVTTKSNLWQSRINTLNQSQTTTNTVAFTSNASFGTSGGSFLISELILYPLDQSPNRGAISYNINNYYNIYPQTSSFTTSSFTIQAGPTSVSASLNNRLTSGISTSGPLGLITVSRTGSNSLTIARNGVTSSFAVPASGALSTGIYLGAINNNGLALGNSPLNISFASVGTGLTGAESTAYFNLVNSLNYRLGRGVNAEYDAVLEYAILQGYTLPSVDQQALQNQLISDLKNAGIWNKLDIFYVFATNGDQNFARLNWKNPLLYTTTNVTSNPIFRTNIGFTGPNRLNTNFPSTSGVNYTLNDASRHAWVYFSYGGNQRIDSAGGSNYNAMENRAGAYTSINNNFNVFSSDLSGAGMLSIHRTSNTSVTTFKGTVGTTHTAASETLSSSPQYIFGGTVDISMYSMGASLVTENNNYIAAFQSYLTAISS